MRQFRENRNGDRSAIFPNERAIIDITGDDKMILRSSLGDVIAVSNDIEAIKSRINYAQPDVETVVIYKGRSMSLVEYEQQTAPTVFRLFYSRGELTGYIAAIDCVINGQASQPTLLYDEKEISEYVNDIQQGDGFYFVSCEIRKPEGLGGLETYELREFHGNDGHLRRLIREERARLSDEMDEESEVEDESKRNIQMQTLAGLLKSE